MYPIQLPICSHGLAGHLAFLLLHDGHLQSLQGQVRDSEADVESQAQLELQSQHGLFPLLKRVIILHCSKLVVLAIFAAAMQMHGALGWILVGMGRSSTRNFKAFAAMLRAQALFKEDAKQRII